LSGSVEEFKALSTAARHLVNACDNVGRHWELCPARAVEKATCVEVEKVIAAMYISSRAEGNGANGMRTHGVVMVLVYLGIGAKLNAAVFIEIDVVSGDNVVWTQGWGALSQKLQ
jgi:hypothetical protein